MNFWVGYRIYQLLGGFVFICMYYLVFYDPSDDILEYIWVYWKTFATKVNVCDKKYKFATKIYVLFPPKMIYVEMGSSI